MKRLHFIIVSAVLVSCLSSCGIARNLKKTEHETRIESVTATDVEKSDISRYIDTTRHETGRVVITEIEFFPPVAEPTIPRPAALDTNARLPPDGVGLGARDNSVNDIANVGKVQGAVKTIRQTVIEREVEQQGKTEEQEKQEESKSTANVSIEETEKVRIEEPTKDPMRWRYIFYLSFVAVAVAVVLYLKRKPMLNVIRKILSGLRRTFVN